MGRWHRTLRQRGHEVTSFSYRTVRATTGVAADRLARLIQDRSQDGHRHVVLIGHSMGGLVALKAIAQLDESIEGDLIFLGSPINGSRTARSLAGIPGGKWLLGHARDCLTGNAVLEPPSSWRCSMIAGTRRMGLGVLLGGARSEGDGTVSLAETRAAYLRQRIELPVTHSSMLWSTDCIEAALEFIAPTHTVHTDQEPAGN